MYASETACPFPIYADPTRQLYNMLGLQRTLNLGVRPDYQRRGAAAGALNSVRQALSVLKGGKAFQGGDLQQVGGEFLFEPTNMATPIHSPVEERKEAEINAQRVRGALGSVEGEEKRITWCHRMRNTRDHAELPELREVLGLDSEGAQGNDPKRWARALHERKGSGLSSMTS
jgi:hypothetical protein